MPRKKKQDIKVNSNDSLEGLMQEVYNDSCKQIKEAQVTINEMSNAAKPEDVDDLTKIAKEKINAQKIKESAIKIKLEVAKLQSDIIKHHGNVDEAVSTRSGGSATAQDFKTIRDMIEKKGNNDE